VFIVGARDGTDFQFPVPTHRDPEVDPGVFDAEMPTYNSAWSALSDVKPDKSEDLCLRGKWAELLPSIPEGNNYLWHTERGGGVPLFGWRRRYWCFLLKLAKDRPSWTLQAQPGPATGPFHWDNRRLSMRELCRLQTFPDDVQILGNYLAVHKQVGTAVPSLLAEVVARSIRTQILGLKQPRGEIRLLPLNQGIASPRPRRLQPVAEKYLELIGDHEAHPGTGKGYGALSRATAAE
jgi:DNA (cytosine-5)-methyltransferase 1